MRRKLSLLATAPDNVKPSATSIAGVAAIESNKSAAPTRTTYSHMMHE